MHMTDHDCLIKVVPIADRLCTSCEAHLIIVSPRFQFYTVYMLFMVAFLFVEVLCVFTRLSWMGLTGLMILEFLPLLLGADARKRHIAAVTMNGVLCPFGG